MYITIENSVSLQFHHVKSASILKGNPQSQSICGQKDWHEPVYILPVWVYDLCSACPLAPMFVSDSYLTDLAPKSARCFDGGNCYFTADF